MSIIMVCMYQGGSQINQVHKSPYTIPILAPKVPNYTNTNTHTHTSTYTVTYAADAYTLITNANTSLGLVLCRLVLSVFALAGGFLSLVGSSDVGSSVVALFLFLSPLLALVLLVFFLYAHLLFQGSDFCWIGVTNVTASMPSRRW